MITHLQILRYFLGTSPGVVSRKLSQCPVISCQNLNGNRCWFDARNEPQACTKVHLAPSTSYGERWIQRSRTKGGSERQQHGSSRMWQIRATPRSSALQRERREMSLMKVLGVEGCIAEEVLDKNTKDRLLGETPLLFCMETSFVQSLRIKASDLKDSAVIRERVEKGISELLHIDTVMGSAVPCTENRDDIIIGTESRNSITEADRLAIQRMITHNNDSLFKFLLPEDSTGKRVQPDIDLDNLERKAASAVDERGPAVEGSVVAYSSGGTEGGSEIRETTGGPDKEQLELMYHRLSEEMPDFFEHSHDYSMYSHDLEFDNRIMGVKTKGLAAYRATVQSLKLASTAYLVNAHLEVLRLTMDPEQGCIHARWRLKGVPLHSFALRPFAKKHKLRYFDAFSIFRVGSDGLIVHHRLDKVMPDSEKVKEPSLVTRIGMALGLIRQPAMGTSWMTGDPPQV